MLNTRISWHFPHQEGGLVEEAPQENRGGCHHRPGFSKDCRDAPHHRDEQCHAKERHHLQVIQWKGAACLGMHGIDCLRLPQIASDCFRLLQIASMLTENLQSPIIFPKLTAKKLKRGNCKVWDSTQLLQDFGLHRPQISSMWAHPPWSGHNVPVVPSQRFSYLWK